MLNLTRPIQLFVLFAIAFLVLPFIGMPAQAQQEQQYTQNKSDQALRSDVRVDPATHSLDIQIPLMSYPGRAGGKVPITLYYSSKLWRVEFDDIYEPPGSSGAPRAQSNAEYAEQSVAGWTSSVDVPTIEFTFFSQSYDLTSTNYGQDGGPLGSRGFIARIHAHMPDGSTHELRKDDAPHNWGTESNYGFTGTYYAVDGSRLRFDFDPGAHSGVLYEPDGGRYTFADPQGLLTAKAVQYTDRNGNTLIYNSTTKQWTDTVGRSFSSPLPVAAGAGATLTPGDVQYSLPGLGTSTLTYTFKWRRLYDSATAETVLSNPDPDPNNRLSYAGSHSCQSWPAQSVSPHMFDSSTLAPICASTKFNPVVLAEIVLPNNTSYIFRYNAYGEIDKAYFPTGGYERFQYGKIAPLTYLKPPYTEGNRGVTDRFLSPDGTAGAEIHWLYGIEYTAGTSGPYVLTCTEPNGTIEKRYLYAHPNNYGVPGDIGPQYKSVPFGMDDARTGSTYEERVYSSSGTLLRRKLIDWAVTPSTVTTGPPGPYGNRNSRIVKEVEITFEPLTGEALTKTITRDYDTTNQFTTGAFENAVNEFDFVSMDQATASTASIQSFSTGTALRRKETTFLEATNQSYRDRNLLGMVSSVVVRDMTRGLPQGVVIAQSSSSYDESALLTCGATNWTDPNSSIRGNLTSTTQWSNYNGSTLFSFPSGNYFTSRSQYDQCGNVRVATDANGNQSQMFYSSAFNYAYATSTITAVPDTTGVHSLNQSLSTASNYDLNTGLMLSSTNANGQMTSMVYSDPLYRLTQVTKPDGSHVTTSYSDTPGDIYVRVVADLDASRTIETRQYFDGLGRATRKFLYQGKAGTPWTATDTYYDNMGRPEKVSNAYDTATASGVVPAACSACTVNTYDALGRVLTVTTPDGAHIDSAYSLARVLMTDQAGKQRLNQMDALGRVKDIWEIRAADQWTESVTFPGHAEVVAGYRTHYNYDLLDNLVEVVQSDQPHRFFLYDSLKRLIRTRIPEQGTYGSDITDPLTGNTAWSLKYIYDNNGNLTQRTDPRGVVSTYSYDGLSRNTVVSYSDGTSKIDRYFDRATNGKGSLWYETTTNPSTSALIDKREFTSYDVMGRPLTLRQVLASDGVNYEYISQRTYNQAGLVSSQTYPSSHVITYNYDVAGRLADKDGSNLGLTGNLGDGVLRTYASSLVYNARGQLAQEQFGTQTPLYHKLHYNVRGQLYDIRLSTYSLQANEFDWNRGVIVNYFTSDYSWGGSGPGNNGNLTRQEHWAPIDDNVTSWHTTHDTFTYDNLNRLTNITEFSSTQNGYVGTEFTQTFDYDRFGNRTINQTGTTQITGLNHLQTAISGITNRLYAPGETDASHSLINYDAAGNQTKDYYSSTGFNYDRIYDAENRMSSSTVSYAGGGSTLSTYSYDGGGRRTRRKIGTTEFWQIYGMNGELLAEYDAKAPAFLVTKEYGYRGTDLLVTMSSGDVQRLKRFVKNLYYNALARDPSAAELQQKIDALGQAGAQGGEPQLLTTARSAARGLFETSEYSARGRTDSQYVTDLYNAYLQRGPDSGGLAFWVSNTQANGRGATLNAFEVSTEFATLSSTLYGTATSDNQRVEHFIQTFYFGALQREPTSAEMLQQTQRLNNATALGQSNVVSEARAMGAEIFQATGYNSSHTVEQYVTDLYEAFLQRAPDGPGLNFWVNNTNSNGRAATLAAFQASSEFGELAGTLYRESFWLVGDHLGTPRMIIGRAGSLASIKRHDYLPFGEDLGAGIGGRTSANGYSDDAGVRQKFTAKERDTETSLDYFGARYYASSQGRFTGVDSLMSSGQTAHPQSWNRYTYCLNQPLLLIDPTGLIWGTYYDDAGQQHYHWYANMGELEAAHATVVTNFVYKAASGIYVTLNPNANQYTTNLTLFDAKRAYWGYTGLAASWNDWVPVWGQFRRLMFNYATGNYEGAIVNFSMASVDGGTMASGFLSGVGRKVATEGAEEGVLRFSQMTASPVFSDEGAFAGKTIGQLAEDLRSGAISPKDVPVQVVDGADGVKLIVNTRSSLALTRAGIPQSSWNIIDMSANQAARANIADRLFRNGLTNQGSEFLRITGMGKFASSLK